MLRGSRRRRRQLEQHAAGALGVHEGDATIVGARLGLLGHARPAGLEGFGVGVDVVGAQGDVVDAVLQNYERLDAEIKAELPLKRIWVVVNDEVE